MHRAHTAMGPYIPCIVHTPYCIHYCRPLSGCAPPLLYTDRARQTVSKPCLDLRVLRARRLLHTTGTSGRGMLYGKATRYSRSPVVLTATGRTGAGGVVPVVPVFCNPVPVLPVASFRTFPPGRPRRGRRRGAAGGPDRRYRSPRRNRIAAVGCRGRRRDCNRTVHAR
jgi:hypothetical protein